MNLAPDSENCKLSMHVSEYCEPRQVMAFSSDDRRSRHQYSSGEMLEGDFRARFGSLKRYKEVNLSDQDVLLSRFDDESGSFGCMSRIRSLASTIKRFATHKVGYREKGLC